VVIISHGVLLYCIVPVLSILDNIECVLTILMPLFSYPAISAVCMFYWTDLLTYTFSAG